MASSKKPTPQQAAEDLKQRKHRLAAGQAEQMVKALEKVRKQVTKAKKDGNPIPESTPEWPKSWTVNKAVFRQLMKKPGCIGIRIFPALNNEGKVTLVMMAVDDQGNNIITAPPATQKALKPGEQALDLNAFDEVQHDPPFQGDQRFS